jgi:streptomycin 6-kinase
VSIPAGLGHWRSRPDGAAWLDRLPSLVAEMAVEWELELREPFEPASVALVVPCRLRTGEEAVLKLSGPDADGAQEAEALHAWRGGPVVELVRHDGDRGALLLRRCVPGDQLWSVEDDAEATRIAAAVLRPLLVSSPAPHPFRALSDVAAEWEEAILGLAAGRDHRHLARVALDALATLRACAGGADDVLLSLDLHGGNVLRDGDAWVAIDPKPVVGDPALAAASLLRDRRWLLGDPAADVARLRARLDVLERELGLDRERMRLWGVVHALAWADDGGALDAGMLASARVLATLR